MQEAKEKRNKKVQDDEVVPCTMGVWVYSPIRLDEYNQSLLLLDFQGFDDNVDDLVNSKLMAIATLLSSTLLYNLKHSFSYENLKQLKPVTELPNVLKLKESHASNSTLVTQLTPRLVILLRDSQVKLEDVTGRQYLEQQLALFAHQKDQKREQINVRAALLSLFPDRDLLKLA